MSMEILPVTLKKLRVKSKLAEPHRVDTVPQATELPSHRLRLLPPDVVVRPSHQVLPSSQTTSPHKPIHPHHLHWAGENNTMPLPRPTRLITTPSARLQIIPNPALRSTAVQHQQQRQQPLSTTRTLRSDNAHEDHYDPPGGWLWGVKPGEKYENEGWENVWYYGFIGSLAFGVVGYCYKPDTR